MSIFNKALIRSVEYLKERGFLDVMLHSQHDIPIYYQYSQATVVGKLPEKNIIGFARNIREEDGMIICTVELHDMKSLASNFMGLIDNYTIKTKKTSQSNADVSYELVRFVVYDKDFKRKVDEQINERAKSAANTTAGAKPAIISMHGDSSGGKYTRIERTGSEG